ncbi:Heat shock protein ssb1 [Sporothrix bragantina]|uniref:Heat shock protein ssb1 n=1 Tax=Sporothrix bragantina TaxID=671064 RepID=A0ABP0BVZ4_9PEZI
MAALNTQATIEIDSLLDGKDLSMQITRARFEELNSAAFESTVDPVAQVLKDSRMPVRSHEK